MQAIQLSDRAFNQREISLTPYLFPRRDLVDHNFAARKLNLRASALVEMLASGLGPEPRAAYASGWFWFEKWQIQGFKYWVRNEATDEDLALMAEIIRKRDRIGDYSYHEGESSRSFMFRAIDIQKPV